MLHAAIISLITASNIHGQVVRMNPEWEEAFWKISPLYRSDTLTICITGDLMMHSMQIGKAHQKDGTYGFSSYFRHIEDRIKSADIAIGNMEFTLGGAPYSGYPAFSAPDSYAEYLADTGFDVFLLANNHIFDKGASGARRTLELYNRLTDSHGILTTGLASSDEDLDTGTPLMIRRKGINLALINLTYGTNLGCGESWPKTNYMNDKELISKAFSKAEDADLTIVLPHWGTEYALEHSKSQRQTAEKLIDQGADIIIGSHPHVVQDTECIKGVPVIYSLGNTVSNMSAANTQVGLMVTLRIIRQANGDITMKAPEYTFLWCSRPGGFADSYTVLPIKRFIGTRDIWKGAWEYDKMIKTYNHVKTITGITE